MHAFIRHFSLLALTIALTSQHLAAQTNQPTESPLVLQAQTPSTHSTHNTARLVCLEKANQPSPAFQLTNTVVCAPTFLPLARPLSTETQHSDNLNRQAQPIIRLRAQPIAAPNLDLPPIVSINTQTPVIVHNVPQPEDHSDSIDLKLLPANHCPIIDHPPSSDPTQRVTVRPKNDNNSMDR